MKHTMLIGGFAALLIILATIFTIPKKSRHCPQHMSWNRSQKKCTCNTDYDWSPVKKQCVHSKLMKQQCADIPRHQWVSPDDPSSPDCNNIAQEQGFESCSWVADKKSCCCIQ
jgi:hypothetical protein